MCTFNLKLLVTLVCLPSFIFHMISNGIIGTSITSIQNRFQLQSTEVGVVVAATDIGTIVATIVVALAGENINKPRWISVNAVIIAIGSLLCSIPHFISPPYEYEVKEFTNYCGNVTENECEKTYLRNYRFIFMVGMFLIGGGIASIFTHGITYIDDNTTQKQSSMYVSIYYTTAAWGPALGFVMGGALTELYVEPFKDNVDINSGNPLWIGAWWPGFIIAGGLLLIIAVPIFLLPVRLPGVEVKNKVSTASSNAIGLFRNPVFLISCFIVALSQAFTFGFNTFGVKYVEAQFDLPTFLASVAYGTVAVVTLVTGYITSGLILSKLDLQMKGIIKFCLIGSFLSVIFTFVFFFHCEEIDFANGNETIIDNNVQGNCNVGCNCSTDWYKPVRGTDGRIYFSPCYAGCTVMEHDGGYKNCSCVEDGQLFNETVSNSKSIGEAYTVDTLADRRCSETMGVGFAIFLGLAFLTTVITIAPTTQITLRCVKENQRSFSLGIQQLIAMALGNIPGRALVGKVLDSGCIAWSTKCGEVASCKFYRKWDIALYMFYLLFAEAALIFLLYVIMYFVYIKTKKST